MGNLSTPPTDVLSLLTELMFQTIELLQNNLEGVRDLRVLFIRAVRLANMLIERYDKSLADRLTNYNVSVQYIRRRCAFCQCVLPEENNAALSLTLTDTEKRISATGTG